MQPVRRIVAIVDDEECVRKALARLLASAGIESRSFASGAALIESVPDDPPACIILDLHMPGMSGSDVQTRLKDAGHDVPIVVITGHDTPEAEHQVKAAGAVAYLRKPVDGQVLLEAVEAAMRKAASR